MYKNKIFNLNLTLSRVVIIRNSALLQCSIASQIHSYVKLPIAHALSKKNHQNSELQLQLVC